MSETKKRKLKSLLYTATVFAAVLFLLAACASAPKMPDWVTNYPADNAYYIGIGSSDSGNEADDNEIARKRAMSNLAAEISAVISSEVNYRTSEDNMGNVEQQAQEEITQLVEQNLKAVETVDAWYSPDAGYWYYMRLNKAEWMAIQKREMADIERRVKNIVEPVLGNPDRSVADILPVLVDGWTIVAESPYPGMIQTQLMGESGALIDLLERQIALYIGSLTISLTDEQITAEAGQPVQLQFTVKSGKGNKPGQLQIDLVDRNSGNLFVSCTTPTSGRYDDSIDLTGLSAGKNYVTAVLNTDVLGFQDKAIQLNPPKTDFLIDLQKIKTSLNVEYTGDLDEFENESGIYGTVKAMLSESLPVKIESGTEPVFGIDFKLNYRNAPPNDYGFTIIYIKANISILKNGVNLYTYETEEFKGAGLNWTQANTKGLEKLFEQFNAGSDFSGTAGQAFSVD